MDDITWRVNILKIITNFETKNVHTRINKTKNNDNEFGTCNLMEINFMHCSELNQTVYSYCTGFSESLMYRDSQSP